MLQLLLPDLLSLRLFLLCLFCLLLTRPLLTSEFSLLDELLLGLLGQLHLTTRFCGLLLFAQFAFGFLACERSIQIKRVLLDAGNICPATCE
ncbi:MAG: hypothetical protein ABSA97_11910 [Verrucomicrobiia bacterium]